VLEIIEYIYKKNEYFSMELFDVFIIGLEIIGNLTGKDLYFVNLIFNESEILLFLKNLLLKIYKNDSLNNEDYKENKDEKENNDYSEDYKENKEMKEKEINEEINETIYKETKLKVKINKEKENNEMYLGYKTNLIRILANLCYKNPKNQIKFNELGLIPIVLSCSSIDFKNPCII
jgi:hypothetical protein